MQVGHHLQGATYICTFVLHFTRLIVCRRVKLSSSDLIAAGCNQFAINVRQRTNTKTQKENTIPVFGRKFNEIKVTLSTHNS